MMSETAEKKEKKNLGENAASTETSGTFAIDSPVTRISRSFFNLPVKKVKRREVRLVRAFLRSLPLEKQILA